MAEQQNELPDSRRIYVDIAATLIRSLVHIPGFSPTYRDKLYACLTEMRNADDNALAELTKTIERTCTDAVAELEVSPVLKDQEAELRRIVDTISESIRSVTEANAMTGNRIDKQLSDLHQAIVEDGQPVLFSKKIEVIANSIKETTSILKTELEQSRSQVKEAGGKIKRLETELEQTREETLKDGLTGIHNRRAFNSYISNALASYNAQRPWCMVLLDIDHFKHVNDAHGHIIGDALLIKLSRTLTENLPANGFLARYGGEEFVIMLPATNIAEGVEFCENVQKKVRASRWIYRTPDANELTISVTVSAGVAVQRPSDTPEVMTARADRGLYLAKEQGRDCTRSELDFS